VSEETGRDTGPGKCQVIVDGIGDGEVTVSERGEGHPVLLLHGGGGPLTVTAGPTGSPEPGTPRVLTPVHPGFSGTPRPAALD
jgi:pimeloyl-ACP methyl ester carboxylesterase